MFLKVNFIQIFKINKFTTQTQEVILKEVNKCGVITLNRPKVLNSLSMNMINLIYPTLRKWHTDSNITHVVIEGNGERAFCAGGDIRYVSEGGKSNIAETSKYFYKEYIMNHLIGTFGKPYISLLNGITMGAGFGLSVHGQYRVATEKTVFAMPETAIGLYPDVGGGYFLPRLPKNMGIYLGLTGARLKGKDVVSVGVATHYVDSHQMGNLKADLVAASNPTEIESILCKYNEYTAKHEFSLSPFIDLIDEQFSKTSIEGILDSLAEKVQTSNSVAEKVWCNEQISRMRQMSPTSLKITLRQLLEGRKKNFKECFVTEFRLSVRCLENKDFHEGVRAVIIDKDNKPNWNPSSIEEVTDDMVDKYFQPLVNDLII